MLLIFFYLTFRTNDQLLFVNDFKFRTVEALKEFIHNQKENICFVRLIKMKSFFFFNSSKFCFGLDCFTILSR